MGQPTRDTNYVAMPMNFERTKETTERQEGDWLPGSRLAANPPLDQTEPRLEMELRATDNVMAAGNTYYHCDPSTREWERRWVPNPHTRQDPEVRREGNDVTQAAFQSPYAHLADWSYERIIYTRSEASTVFCQNEGGAELPPVQRAQLGRGSYPELSHREMYEQGMFLQSDMSTIPTGGEHGGRGIILFCECHSLCARAACITSKVRAYPARL